MRRVVAASDAGDPQRPNEDWALATDRLIVVLDGATARTGTGCAHGVAWYAATLGAAIADAAVDHDLNLRDVLTAAIGRTAARHRQCDLGHPGTPSAATAIVRFGAERVEYLVLGDTLVLLDSTDGLQLHTDDRVGRTAAAYRAEADRRPFGSAAKQAALRRMKHAELAARNSEGGYWIAAADPAAARYALTGVLPRPDLRRVAVLTDGAARLVTPFGRLDWPGLLDVLDREGPAALLHRVRAVEATDPGCRRWPRNKPGDDATAVFAG